jgi:hypothetical protein
MIDSTWLLLITSIAGGSSSLRVRSWRQLKGIGAAALRDGAYLLPAGAAPASVFRALREELQAGGAAACIVDVPAQADELQREWLALFDRTPEYERWARELVAFTEALPASESDGRRQLRQRRKDLDNIAALDFFAGEALELARRRYADAERQITRRYSPDEPIAETGAIPQRRIADYRRRLWATRARPWVDRVASAWLIRRFIDREARFLWLADIAACPADALGFDFDGATFTHVGERVTFEVLLASFGLNADAALQRLGALVRALDLGGEPTPEGAGFEAILAGARQRLGDDDALLAEAGTTLDSLYAYFSTQAGGTPAKKKSIKKSPGRKSRRSPTDK